MKKNVEYEGKEYKITFQAYGYGDSRFCVNGEPTSWWMSNEKLTSLEHFRKMAKDAIEEYEAKRHATEIFEKWDGKI